MQTLIGARIGDYDIEAEIGRGAMGVVYRARQVSLNRPVALKVLPAHFAQDQAYISRFHREAQAAAALSHSNIVHVYAASTTDDLHYFVMEYVEGETLHDRLAREGRIPPDEAIAICVYLAQALDYAWKKARIIHRDIKPSNIFLSNDGEVKLGDLGLAKSVGDMSAGQSVTKDGQTVGTAYFMSPEQARGEHGLDFRSDIYSLGCTLYQMISGRYPYEGTFGTVIAKQITEPPPAILKVAPDCPMPVVRLLSKMLAKHPSARHQSHEELIQDLWRAHDQITHPEGSRRREADTPPPQSQPPHVGSYFRKPAVLYAAMTTATIIALAGVLVWAPWKQTEQQPSNSEDAKARIAPVTQTLLSAAAESPKEAPPPGSESRLQAASVSQSQPPAKAGTPNAEASNMAQPSENVGGASAPRPVATQIQATADRGTEAPPTFQQPVAERASVQQSEQHPAAGTLARSATNAAIIQLAQAAPPPPPATSNESRVTDHESFLKSVSAMAPEQQVQAVIAKLKELNSNFDGKETHKIEGGAVATLSFSSVGVTDVSPVKALRWLRTLNMAPPALNQKGSLENLAPLQGMQLTWLWCHNNPINDLSPLKGMPLATLSVGGTQVSDLSPLAGMKLQVLSFNDTVVSELGPLEGMPLTVLWCNNTKVADLTPLKAMPLREIKCDFVAERDAAVLRGIRTLTKINDLPAATFWMRVGPVVATVTPAGNVGGASVPRPVKATPPPSRGTEAAPALVPATTGTVSAKEQIRRFVEKMKELNPEFNPENSKLEYQTEGGKVVELSFTAASVTDISPIRSFTHLKRLFCTGVYEGTKTSPKVYGPAGKLADLSPLSGMRIEELTCYSNQIRDLGPLQGMPLKMLDCRWNPVADLSPLKGAPLTTLICWSTKVSDLSPLAGAPLVVLKVGKTEVADISPLRKMKLTTVEMHETKITDLTPLKGMPLVWLSCDFVLERDTKILRAFKTLVKINNMPEVEFWKRVKAGEAPQVK